MSLLAIGLNHASASVDARGRFAIASETLAQSVHGLRDHLGQDRAEAAILSTCNRTELYIAANDERCLKAPALDWLAARGGWRTAELAPHAYALEGTEAARHAWKQGMQLPGVRSDQIEAKLGGANATKREAFAHDFEREPAAYDRPGAGVRYLSFATPAIEIADRHF